MNRNKIKKGDFIVYNDNNSPHISSEENKRYSKLLSFGTIYKVKEVMNNPSDFSAFISIKGFEEAFHSSVFTFATSNSLTKFEGADETLAYKEKEHIQCKNCFFCVERTYDEVDIKYLSCRKHAPVLVPSSGETWWPNIEETDWCGDFKLKE